MNTRLGVQHAGMNKIQAIGSKRCVIFLLCWGVLWACFFVLPYAQLSAEEIATIDQFYMSSRITDLDDAMIKMAAHEGVQPVGDFNFGFYLYYSFIGVLVGQPPAYQVILLVQMSIAFITFVVYPGLLWLVSKSLAVAICTPFLFHVFLGRYLYLFKFDVYWAPAWVVVAAIPLLLLLYQRKWDKYSWGIFVSICLCLSIANTIRPHCSLGVLFLLFFVVFVKLWQKARKENQKIREVMVKYWKPLLIIVVIAIFFYLLLFSIVPSIYKVVYPHSGHTEGNTAWHALYIGIGWEENPYGIVYSDAVGLDLMERLAPGTTYANHEYGRIVRSEYFRLFAENPTWFLFSYVRKAIQCLYMVFSYNQLGLSSSQYTLLCVLLIAAVSVIWSVRDKKVLAHYAMGWYMLLLCAPFMFIHGMISIPSWHYLSGASAVYEWMQFLLCIAAVHMIGKKVKQWHEARKATSKAKVNIVPIERIDK